MWLVIIVICIFGCTNNRIWKNNDFIDWYGKYWHDEKIDENIRALFYRGTSDKYHHFIMRTVDSWLLVRIDKGEVSIEEERQYKTDSSAKFPGYYIVDPMNDYKKVD